LLCRLAIEKGGGISRVAPAEVGMCAGLDAEAWAQVAGHAVSKVLGRRCLVARAC